MTARAYARPQPDSQRAPLLGAVLVGGRSRRMGRDKALIELDGVPMVQRIATVLGEAGCRRVIAVGPIELCATVEHVDDDHPGQGPLGGIITALTVAAPVLVVACDMPHLDAATLVRLVAAHDTAPDDVDAVVAFSNRIEPLCAVWRATALTPLTAAFTAGERAVHRALEGLVVLEVRLPAAVLRNVNIPADLESR